MVLNIIFLYLILGFLVVLLPWRGIGAAGFFACCLYRFGCRGYYTQAKLHYFSTLPSSQIHFLYLKPKTCFFFVY